MSRACCASCALRRRVLLVAVAAALWPGPSCGGRSGLGGLPALPADGGAPGQVRDGPGPDTPPPLDHGGPPDACRQLPRAQVEGVWVGALAGTSQCGGETIRLSGKVLLQATATDGAGSYDLTGSLLGDTSLGTTFFSALVDSTLRCDQVQGEAEFLQLTVGGASHTLEVTFAGLLSPYLDGSGRYAMSVQWQAREPGGRCQASGYWEADLQ